MSTRLPIALLMVAMSAAPAHGQAPATRSDYLARLDLDGDGRVSLAEYRDYMSRGFRRMDVDGNGILEGDEHAVPGAAPLSLSDHLESLRRTFTRQDRNGDGYLDAAELTAPPQ